MEIKPETRIRTSSTPIVSTSALDIDRKAAMQDTPIMADLNKPLINIPEHVKNYKINGTALRDMDWGRIAISAGGSILAHYLASSLLSNNTDAERHRESIGHRLLRLLVPLGAAAAGGYGLYSLAKSGAANDGVGANGGAGTNGIHQTRIGLDGSDYWVDTSALPYLQRFAQGYVPGKMQSSEAAYINEQGKKILGGLDADSARKQLIGYGLGGGAIGGAAYSGWQDINGLLEYLQRRKTDSVINRGAATASVGADTKIDDLMKLIRQQQARPASAEKVLLSGKGNLAYARKMKSEADNLGDMLMKRVEQLRASSAQLPKGARPPTAAQYRRAEAKLNNEIKAPPARRFLKSFIGKALAVPAGYLAYRELKDSNDDLRRAMEGRKALEALYGAEPVSAPVQSGGRPVSAVSFR